MGFMRRRGAHLEGAAMLGGDNVAHLVHHSTKALHLLRRPEALQRIHEISKSDV